MKEWKDIQGYEGLYKVSPSGEIYSVLSDRILRPIKSSTGYYHVSLYSNHKVKSFNVHILVANAFLPPKNGCDEINHIDGNKANNSLTNLERVTRHENVIHALRNNLIKPPLLGRKGEMNPHSKVILQYSIDGDFIREWHGISEAARGLGCTYSAIAGCIHGRKLSAKGFLWREKLSDDVPLMIDPPKRGCIKKGNKQIKIRIMHRIQQLSKSGELIKTWENYSELTQETGYNNGNIYKCINGKLKSAYGYIWRYEE